MQRIILALGILMGGLATSFAAQGTNNNSSDLDSFNIGAGVGIPYGVVGINADFPIVKNFHFSWGLGTTIMSGIGYNSGIKYYLRSVKNSWRPRILFNFGTTGILEVSDPSGKRKKKYYSFSLGIGQKGMWGKTKTHGIDLDILYILGSEIFDDIDEYAGKGYAVNSESRTKLSVGYRYSF